MEIHEYGQRQQDTECQMTTLNLSFEDLGFTAWHSLSRGDVRHDIRMT